MTITQLVYFAAVAEELNITKVAERFHVSQPAVSSAIRDLEKEFHITLFERYHNELFLTVMGNTAYREARRLLDHYEEFKSGLRELKINRPVSLAISPNIAAIHLPRLFPCIQREMPEAVFNIEENTIANMTQMLKNNLLDAACFACGDDRKDAALTYIPIGSFAVSMCAASSMLQTEREISDLHILEGVPMVFQFKSSQLNTGIFEYFSRYHITPNVILYANQLITIVDFVKNGIAVGFLPPELIEREKGIVQYTLPDCALLNNLTIYFVYKKRTPITDEVLRALRVYFQRKTGAVQTHP